MDSSLSTETIDDYIENTAGVILSPDTVAIWEWEMKLYGIYKKDSDPDVANVWNLIMTTSNIQPFMETK